MAARGHPLATAAARATIGARRLTSSARSICSTVKSSSCPLRRQRRVGDEDLDVAGLARRAARARRVGEVDGERAAAELGASGSSTSARRPVRTSCAPRAASARAIAWPMPPLAPVSRTVPAGDARVACRRSRAEQRDGRREGVQEALAADRADLAGREEARRRRAGELLATARRRRGPRRRTSPRPRPLQQNASAPAGRRRRARRRAGAAASAGRGRPRRRRARAAAAPDRPAPAARPRASRRPGRRRAAGARGSRRARSRAAAVDDEPDQQAAGDQRAIGGVELLDHRAYAVERRAARQLADDVALGLGDRQLGADRRRALRDARQQLDVVEAHADGAAVDAPRRRGTATPSRRARARAREPADHRHARRARREVLQQRVGREGEGVGQQDRARARPRGPPSR